jgi:hypothetical protein
MHDKAVSPLARAGLQKREYINRCSDYTTAKAMVETAYLLWGTQTYKLRRLASLESGSKRWPQCDR